MAIERLSAPAELRRDREAEHLPDGAAGQANYWESHLPYGGRAGSQSGLGRVGGRFSIKRLTELKTIVVNLA